MLHDINTHDETFQAHVPHVEHVKNGEARSAVKMMPCCPPPILLHGSASEVNSSSADVQVVSCHQYLVFHLFVE